MFDKLAKFLGADKETQKKRIVENCVNIILCSYIGNEKISPLQSSLVLNEIRKSVFDNLKTQLQQKETEEEEIKLSLQNIDFNDTAK